MNRVILASALCVVAAGFCSTSSASSDACFRDAATKYAVPESLLREIYAAENGPKAERPGCRRYAEDGKALAGAMQRTKGDTQRAMAYLHGGELGLRQFDRSRKPAREASGECPPGYAPLRDRDYCSTLKGTLRPKLK